MFDKKFDLRILILFHILEYGYLIIKILFEVEHKTMLGEKIDDEVNQFKKDLRASGGVVNTIVVVTAARGIAGAENRALLKKKRWTHGCLPRNTFIIFNEKIQKKIQKDTKIVRKLLDIFEKK